jgi:hypothetical protein
MGCADQSNALALSLISCDVVQIAAQTQASCPMSFRFSVTRFQRHVALILQCDLVSLLNTTIGDPQMTGLL